MSWPGSENTKAGTSRAAMSQRCSSADLAALQHAAVQTWQHCSMQQCRPGSVAACSSTDLAALQHATVQTRHLKIGWFRVIKRDGLGDNPLADQHQLMDQ